MFLSYTYQSMLVKYMKWKNSRAEWVQIWRYYEITRDWTGVWIQWLKCTGSIKNAQGHRVYFSERLSFFPHLILYFLKVFIPFYDYIVHLRLSQDHLIDLWDSLAYFKAVSSSVRWSRDFDLSLRDCETVSGFWSRSRAQWDGLTNY